MLVKLVATILLSFVIAVPLTIWFLKRARIKAKLRHVQVSLVLGIPISLFIFLSQTRFIWLLLVATGLTSSLVIGIEFILRQIVRGSKKPQFTFEQGPNGTNVSFDQARTDSGFYPDNYLTRDLWSEMLSFRKEIARQISIKRATATELERWFPRHGYQSYRNITIQGENFSMLDGYRKTTDVDKSFCRNKLFIFGGSTVFCDEMPDRFTNASFLQRLLNKRMRPLEVINCGMSGASVSNRVKMLGDFVKLDNGDKVVFYFGDNEAGWARSTENGVYLSEKLIPLLVRSMKVLKTHFGFELAGWVYQELAPKWMIKYSDIAVGATIDALNDAHEYCKSRGAEMLVILQPNLYTLRTKYPSESQAERRFSSLLKIQILNAYKKYEEWVKETPYAVSATHIFDNAPAPVFLDWAHVNARGNEIIAKFIFEELQRRGMLSSDSKL
jgi:hypothetical protein